MYIFSSLLTFCHIYTNAQMNFLKSSSHSIELLDYMQYLKLLSWMPLVLSCHHHRLLMISACRRNAQEILFATMKNRLHYFFLRSLTLSSFFLSTDVFMYTLLISSELLPLQTIQSQMLSLSHTQDGRRLERNVM